MVKGTISIYSMDGTLVSFKIYRDKSDRNYTINVWKKKYSKNNYYIQITHDEINIKKTKTKKK